MARFASFVAALLLLVDTAQAQLFSGPSGFSQTPISQLGPLVNNLTLTDTANGFVVAGQVIVNVPPGPAGGVLVSWTVDRPLNPAYGTSLMTTTTILDGFVQPPIGIFQPTAGSALSEFTNYSGTSSSWIPITLVNGATIWPTLSVTSSTFSYTSGGANFLRQRFDLDGVQINGPGGVWIVDVPATTFATAVPEPSSLALAAAGALLAGGAVARRRLRKNG